jgi:ABC-type multidrug transport system ATPase subunit
MNQLINDIFGDSYITLGCQAGECLHYSMVPGFEAPAPPNNSKLVAASIAVTGLLVIIACLAFWYLGRIHKHDFGGIRLAGDGDDAAEVDRLMSNHLPGSLSFENLSYIAPNGKQVLSGVSGNVRSGQLLAIMGASGAGKSTFLDILAKKTKRGSVSGEVLVNGRTMTADKYKRIVGFVDQDDTLMSTLTVYETVLYSALLRLPRDMSLEAKKLRTLETMQALGILGIKDSRIGEAGKRSISGGEKRRVSIACELVTSPSIIFLDEPTSGLDAFNAINVVECLVNLARDYNRTVVFTIHQPRSNIVAMFDKLLLLAGGKAVYSGDYPKCQDHFESIGHPCPPGFNIADFLSKPHTSRLSRRNC